VSAPTCDRYLDDGNTPCEEYAGFETVRSEEQLCREHAYEALENGEQVYGPNGHFCRIDDDALEIREVRR
jgi:hypothetical protein